MMKNSAGTNSQTGSCKYLPVNGISIPVPMSGEVINIIGKNTCDHKLSDQLLDRI